MSLDPNAYLNIPIFPEDPFAGSGGDQNLQTSATFTNDDLNSWLIMPELLQPTNTNFNFNALNTFETYDDADPLGLNRASMYPTTSQQSQYPNYYSQVPTNSTFPTMSTMSTMSTMPTMPTVPTMPMVPTMPAISVAPPIVVSAPFPGPMHQPVYPFGYTTTVAPPANPYSPGFMYTDLASPAGTVDSASTPVYREPTPPMFSSSSVGYGSGINYRPSYSANSGLGVVGPIRSASTSASSKGKASKVSRVSRLQNCTPYTKENRLHPSASASSLPSSSSSLSTSNPAPKPKSTKPTKGRSSKKVRRSSPAPHASTPTPVPTAVPVSRAQAPPNAVWSNSSENEIQEAMGLLADLLNQKKKATSSAEAAKYYTCPVLDCQRGGWNELLHGIESPAISFLSALPTGEPFYGLNELKRHVKTHHTRSKLAIFYCPHPGCSAQAARDAQAKKEGRDGRGFFCRAEPLRDHFKEFPVHWESVSFEMRVKLRMFKNGGPNPSRGSRTNE